MGTADRPVLIFGSGRSGTTWIQDALAQANHYRTVFEPLHPEGMPRGRPFANLYLRKDQQNDELREFIADLISGRSRGVWTSLRARPDRLWPPLSAWLRKDMAKYTLRLYMNAIDRWRAGRAVRNRPAVVKFIRANLLIEWLRARFDYPAILVVRHPCAVLASVQRRTGAEWEREAMRILLDRYLSQPMLVEDRIGNRRAALESADSLAAIHTAIWCIENAHTLRHSNGVPICYYEDLVTAPQTAWPRLVEAAGLATAPDAEILGRPSQQASYEMGARASASQQISAWTAKLTQEQLADVQGMLDLFGVDAYCVGEPLPADNRSGLQ